jgi:hypothetical protein
VIESGDFCWKTIEERNFEATTAHHPYMMDVCFANEWRERYHLSLSEYLGGDQRATVQHLYPRFGRTGRSSPGPGNFTTRQQPRGKQGKQATRKGTINVKTLDHHSQNKPSSQDKKERNG